MIRAAKVLYLEDRAEDVELLRAALEREYLTCEVTWVAGREAYEAALACGGIYDVILADYRLPDMDGEEALALAKARCPEIPFILLSGHLGEGKGVECLRRGATDYVLKDQLARLSPVIRRALETAQETAARRETQAANRRLAALLKAVLEGTPEGLLVADMAGRISAYNSKFLALCGIPDHVIAPMDLERVLEHMRAQFPGGPESGAGEDPRGNRILVGRDGRRLEQTVRAQRVDDRPLALLFGFRDITEREGRSRAAAGLVAELEALLQGLEAPQASKEPALQALERLKAHVERGD
ncbi:MAG TPA: response regulator [Holophaga sp.]|nr:response regulator [Holophaga sp.]